MYTCIVRAKVYKQQTNMCEELVQRISKVFAEIKQNKKKSKIE